MKDPRPTASLGAPFFVRVAGLPAETLAGIGSDRCRLALDELWKLGRKERAARQELVDALFREVHDVPREYRGFLLAVKRDCFNGRRLDRRRKDPRWSRSAALAGPSGQRVDELERRRGAMEERFARVYAEETRRSSRALVESFEDSALRRGVALASPEIVTALDRWTAGDKKLRGRKRRSLELSLLRYLTRTVLKISPFSSLTRVGLGCIGAEQGGRLELLGEEWDEHSSMRAKRFFLDQVWDLLTAYPPMRAALALGLNRTLEKVGEKSYRFLRAGHWRVAGEPSELRFEPDAAVKLDLPPAMVERLRAVLAEGAQSRRTLARRLRQDGDNSGLGARDLDRLFAVGLLEAVVPWPVNSPCLERDLLVALRTWPADKGLQKVARDLERLIELEESFAATTAPVAILKQLYAQLGGLRRSAMHLAQDEVEVPPEPVDQGSYYEDVLLRPRASSDGPIFRLGSQRAGSLVASVEPLLRLAELYSHHSDFQHTLAEFCRQQWPLRNEFSFLEVFFAAQPLWREFSRFCKSSREDSDDPPTTFDPFGLPVMQGLQRQRQVAWNAERWTLEDPAGFRILPQALQAVLGDLPGVVRTGVGPCLFLQPADPLGERWVVNQMNEGTGRWASRFVALLTDQSESYLACHIHGAKACGVEDQAELLDLVCPQGDTLNVHPLLTPRALEVQGSIPALAEKRRLRFEDLRLRLGDEAQPIWVVDRRGRRYLPVHLGSANHRFMPVMVKFLAELGPGERLSVYPPRPSQRRGDLRSLPRLIYQDLILMRRRWHIAANPLRTRLAGRSPEGAFLEVDRWRREHRLPARVFLLERIGNSILGDRNKPQYLDFSSPLFMPLLRASLKKEPVLTFEEVLPEPESFPACAAGKQWGVEILLDSLTLGTRRNATEISPAVWPDNPALPQCDGRGIQTTSP